MKRVLLIALFLVFTLGAMAAGAGIYKWTIPEAKPTYTLNQELIEGLLKEYVSDIGNPGRHCLTSPRGRSKRNLRGNLMSLNYPTYDGENNKWTLRATGDDCTGIESWEIDDATGAIKYLGSSTSP